jgi:hypothetical protein
MWRVTYTIKRFMKSEVRSRDFEHFAQADKFAQDIVEAGPAEFAKVEQLETPDSSNLPTE